jgi:transposase
MLPGSEIFPRDPDVLIGMVMARDLEIEKLQAALKTAQAMLFLPKSEKSSAILEGQMGLDLGDVELGVKPANDEQIQLRTPSSDRRRPRRNIGALPKHLPRVEQVIEPASLQCPCCEGRLHRIGEDVAEALDGVPATLRVVRTIRPKYACRSCESAIVQAPAKRRLFEGGMATTALIANVVVWKYAWYVPLNRQAQIFAGQGVHLDRSTLAQWVKRSAWWLSSLYRRQLEFIHEQERVFCDETRVPVLEKGLKHARTGWFWAHAVDDRPWKGPAPPAVVYIYAPTRNHGEIRDQLMDFSGTLQVDGYGAYKSLVKRAQGNRFLQPAFCLAHARRKFTDIHKNSASPMAQRIIEQIALVYEVEAQIRGTSADHRRAVRHACSAPLMEALHAMLNENLAQISSKSPLAKAIKYTLAHWSGLNLFLSDGRIEVDSNTVERSMRGIALGRKNSLFAGDDGGAESWAILASLLQTAKLNRLDPFTWLSDALERMVSGEVKSHELDQLLAWNWKAERLSPLQAAA